MDDWSTSILKYHIDAKHKLAGDLASSSPKVSPSLQKKTTLLFVLIRLFAQSKITQVPAIKMDDI